MSSHSYKFLCLSCDARLEGEWKDELAFEQKCLACGMPMDMFYHMFPSGDVWLIPEFESSIDD